MHSVSSVASESACVLSELMTHSYPGWVNIYKVRIVSQQIEYIAYFLKQMVLLGKKLNFIDL